MDGFEAVDSAPSGAVSALEEPGRRLPVFGRMPLNDFDERGRGFDLGGMDEVGEFGFLVLPREERAPVYPGGLARLIDREPCGKACEQSFEGWGVVASLPASFPGWACALFRHMEIPLKPPFLAAAFSSARHQSIPGRLRTSLIARNSIQSSDPGRYGPAIVM